MQVLPTESITIKENKFEKGSILFFNLKNGDKSAIILNKDQVDFLIGSLQQTKKGWE